MTDRLDGIRKRRDAAVEMVSALCKPKYSEGAREWIMSIPARPDYDPDMVIAASLRDIAYLLQEVDNLTHDIGKALESLTLEVEARVAAEAEVERLNALVGGLDKTEAQGLTFTSAEGTP